MFTKNNKIRNGFFSTLFYIILVMVLFTLSYGPLIQYTIHTETIPVNRVNLVKNISNNQLNSLFNHNIGHNIYKFTYLLPGTFTVNVTANKHSGSIPLLVSFMMTASGTPTWYSWNFGDHVYLNSSTAFAPSHLYTEAGFFNVTVTVNVSGTNFSSKPLSIHTWYSPLKLVIYANPKNGTAPLTVQFNGSVFGGTGTYIAFTWHFGDGGTGSGLNINYTYLRPGRYNATLTAIDTSDRSTSAFIIINVATPSNNISTPNSNNLVISVVQLVLFIIGGVAIGVGCTVLLLRFGFYKKRGGNKKISTTNKEVSTEISPQAPAVTKQDTLQTTLTTNSNKSSNNSGFKISDKILIHLLKQGNLYMLEIAPISFTQIGMADSLGVKQNVLTNTLKRLENRGLIRVDVKHVKGKGRRMKTYYLTEKGEAVARELQQTLTN